MRQIIYISTAREAPDETTISSILASSRSNNRRDGLSGVLVIGGRRFLQVLEGSEEVLRLTYDRIRNDDRHYALVQLQNKPIQARSFGNWDMGYERPGSAALGEIVKRLTAELNDANLKAQLRGFAQLHSA